jgi:hypothetical protein
MMNNSTLTYPKCDCFWSKQSWVAKPSEIQPTWIPIEEFELGRNLHAIQTRWSRNKHWR